MGKGLSERAAAWLESRKLCVDTAARLGVYSQGPNIAFPYLQGETELYAKVRAIDGPKSMRCTPAGVEQTRLWNEDCLQEAPAATDTLIITEGEPDALVFLQTGKQHVVSVPSGAANTAEGAKSKALKCLTVADETGDPVLKPGIARFARVLVATDCDHDGLMLRQAIIDVIGDQYCWVPTYPEGSKDANDVLLADGIDGVDRLVATAQPIKSDGFIEFTKAMPKKRAEAMVFGLPWLDFDAKKRGPSLGIMRPEFLVIGGQAGHGKSTVTQALLYSLIAANPSLRASIFHGEGDKGIPIQRARRFYMGRKHPDATSWTERMKAERDFWIDDHLAYIAPPQDELPTFEWLIWAMERQALYRRRNVFVVDPWNEIIHQKAKGASTTEYIGECIIRMKRLADRLGLILIVSHHVAKPKNEGNRPPDRYDLADSAHWANKADHVLLAWKPDEGQNKTRLEIAKSKDHETMGRPGVIWVGLDSQTFQLREVAAKDEPAKTEAPADQNGAADHPLSEAFH